MADGGLRGRVSLLSLPAATCCSVRPALCAPVAPARGLYRGGGAQSALDYAAERRCGADIMRAFSQYLSPALVERLATDPSQLKLGGERRTLSILFCDVRGFTTISETLKDDPEQLTR